MSKRDLYMKITKDGRFWVAGSVVNTLAEAFERYDKKRKSGDPEVYHLEEEPVILADVENSMEASAGVGGTKEYITEWVKEIFRLSGMELKHE